MTAEERQNLIIMYLCSGNAVSYDTHCGHKGFMVGGRKGVPKGDNSTGYLRVSVS